MSPGLVFGLSAAAVILAGIRLAKDGDAIAERTGLGGVWFGAILLAAVTSLPELATGVFASDLGHADLAIGNLFGASMLAMVVLAVMDLVTTEPRVLLRVNVNQTLVGSLAVCLTAVAVAGILAPFDLGVLGVGWATATIGVGYVGGAWLLHANRTEPPFEARRERRVEVRPSALGGSVLRFAAAAAIVLVAARSLADSAAELAAVLGMSDGLFGLTSLAIVTTLPEITVTVVALRAGAVDLAVGALLGSAAFNMFVLLAIDVADGAPSLLFGRSHDLALGGVVGIALIGQVMMGILVPRGPRVWRIEAGPVLMLATYAAGVMLVARAAG